MKIKDLPAPVTAAKADWLPGTHWIGFTPTDGSGSAREQCRSTINSQMNGGYIIEYVTRKFDDPNPGFQSNPRYLADKATNSEVAGKFVAVLRSSPRVGCCEGAGLAIAHPRAALAPHRDLQRKAQDLTL